MQNNTQLQQQNNEKFQITTRTGEVLTLTKPIVKQYIANGADITDSEFTMFFQLCKVHKVNPFLKEAYLIKFGTSPATIVLDYKVLQQVAEDNPHFKGLKTGLVLQNANGEMVEREGSFKMPNEVLIAGWCEVKRDDRNEPTRVYAMFDEFKQYKNKATGELNANWAGKPCFMITKVAKAQALREAFPNMFGSNVYIQEEAEMMNNNTDKNADFTYTSTSEMKANENVVNADTEEVANDFNFDNKEEVVSSDDFVKNFKNGLYD